ncbi:hydrogenase expression/formation protein HypD [Thermanaeromonas toyohensis ToBE]|uniref:Hydrogenase expression/formation protein HypD n=1 Tax=Thermanaeromonas toyohensis ToBE TaxID=698762 RepID=A0A1W1VZT7_9FIRM|nr:hydrogenase formation protein HypD [Thermanaeromonas toyohensis]SMB98892.1 hydrogenase expression/formation protein HypD [Thermanaeromonas toyohensis ToBE]
MKLWVLYRQRELGENVLAKVKALAREAADKLGRRPVIMEVCGTHTVALGRTGLRSLLADYLDLRSGPGCPVCVTAPEDIDYMLLLARQPDVVVATFGDMLRVPGSYGSLEQARAEGSQVQVCYSPREAVELAKSYPDKTVVFLGIGFETTAPAVALALKEAITEKLKNFLLYSAHKLVPPALSLLASDPELGLDGFILPGHVSAILGRQAFIFLAEKYNLPAAIAGFEPLDILGALMELLPLILRREAQVINAYPRVVTETGNQKAQKILEEIFSPHSANWRGLGIIPESGLKLKACYQDFEARERYPLEVRPSPPPAGCRCGAILKGLSLPPECPLFGRRCTPLTPVGPCMVSSEGSCAAYYRYSQNI